MPLVPNESCRPILAVIESIASDVAMETVSLRKKSPNRVTERHGARNCFTGLFHAYSDIAEVVPTGFDTCTTILEECIDDAIRSQGLSLFSGWPGIGWMTSHLNVDDDFVGAHADQLLRAAIVDWPRWQGYDLISGLVGAGVCLVERLPRDSAVHGLTLVLECLEATAVDTDDGTTWFTAPEFLPAWQRQLAPNGYFNLGVAHGVPGVCWLLGKLCLAGIERDRAETLLNGSLRWLRSHQPDPDQGELPSWIAPGVDREPNRRMAWCYGPLGASAVALEAAKAIGDDQSANWARTLALSCAAVAPAEAQIQDAGLCHGAAGNTQIFYRLYRNTGEPTFHAAALRWFESTLAYRRPGEGIGGYRMWGAVEESRNGWLDDASFLTGSGGVGLALLSAVTDVEPKWDRLLLLS